jgi:hypothetical protein
LIVWDRLFGTFELENETPVFGLTLNIRTYNPVKIAFHEWADLWRDVRRTGLLRDKLMYIFGRPDWKHDNPRLAPPLPSLGSFPEKTR